MDNAWKDGGMLEDKWKMAVLDFRRIVHYLALLGVNILIISFWMMFGWHINFNPFVLVIIGLLFISGAIYGMVHRRS